MNVCMNKEIIHTVFYRIYPIRVTAPYRIVPHYTVCDCILKNTIVKLFVTFNVTFAVTFLFVTENVAVNVMVNVTVLVTRH